VTSHYGRTELNDHDDAELRRLVGEIQDRLRELTGLFERARDAALDTDAVAMFRVRPAPPSTLEDAPTVLIEILDNIPGAGADGGPGQCCAIIPPTGHASLACPCGAPPF
jgi:hypothetical protein